MIIRLLFLIILVCLTGTGCNLIYKQNIQQGNALEQDDLDELYIGMNQRQVLFVLGTPSVKDPFHQNRWDYVQTFSRRGNPMITRTVTLIFEDGLLTDILGENDPFGANSQRVDGDPDEVASFVKKPDSAQDTSESPRRRVKTDDLIQRPFADVDVAIGADGKPVRVIQDLIEREFVLTGKTVISVNSAITNSIGNHVKIAVWTELHIARII